MCANIDDDFVSLLPIQLELEKLELKRRYQSGMCCRLNSQWISFDFYSSKFNNNKQEPGTMHNIDTVGHGLLLKQKWTTGSVRFIIIGK